MSASEHYTSGDYWRVHRGDESAHKVALLERAARRARFNLSGRLRLLEVGCGNGAFLIPFAQRCRALGRPTELHGCDISAEGIAQARARAGNIPIDWLCMSVDDVEDQFDAVLVLDVLEHVDAPSLFLAQCRRLSPWLFLHLPIEISILHSITKRPSASYEAFHHIHFYTLETARLILEDAGYQVVTVAPTAAALNPWYLNASLAVKCLRSLRYIAYQVAPALTSFVAGGSVMFACRRTEACSV